MNFRELNNRAFMHRDRARFRAGSSELLGIVFEPQPGDGVVVDVRDVADLYRVVPAARGSVAIGAFASLAAVTEALPALIPPDAALGAARLRLALHDARVTVFGRGTNRSTPFDAVSLAPYEIPATIDVRSAPGAMGVADRRIVTQDGDASHALGVTIGVRVSKLARFEKVRIVTETDGVVKRAADAERALEGARVERDRLPDIARLAGAAVDGRDARSSAIARSMVPLVLACLRDALAAAR